MDDQQSIDEKFLKKLTEILESNLDNENFGVKELAAAAGVSRSQLHRKLKSINGKSSSQFIREFRLEKAMEMLQNNVATASEIAYKVGFSSPTYFSTSFNQYYGYPPGEVKFRNPLNKENSEEIQTSSDTSETANPKRKLPGKRIYLIALLAFFLVASLGWYKYLESKNDYATPNEMPIDRTENSIAVLPFKNISGNPENEAFCDGMTSAIISRLTKIKDINKVISLTSMMSYKDSDQTITEIADELNVRYILESGFQKSGNNIKVNLQLIDGKSDQLFWSQEYQGTYDSIFKVQAQVAEMVARKLDANITKEEKAEIQQAITQNMEAYNNYLQGLNILTKESAKNFQASRKYFEKAIKLDSSFAEAYERLGWTYSHMGTWFGNMSKSKADSLAEPYYKKALELDPDNLDLLRTRAEQEFYSWNFKVADSMLTVYRKEAGDNFFSDFLNLMLGRYDEVIASYNNRKKDNYQSEFGENWPVAYAYYFIDEIDLTVELMQSELIEFPNSEPYYDRFGNLYIALKDYEKAKDVLETGLQISSKRYASMVVNLAIVHYYLNDEEKSRKYLDEVLGRANKGEPEINTFIAHYYARIGNYDEAFIWLEKAYKKHEVELIWLKTDPNLLLLENDPRYKVLCDKIGFPDCQQSFSNNLPL